MNISKVMQICHKEGVKVFPIVSYYSENLYKFDVCANEEVLIENIAVKPRQKDSKRRLTGFKLLNDTITEQYIKQANLILKNNY